jgi:hypothetical protein
MKTYITTTGSARHCEDRLCTSSACNLFAMVLPQFDDVPEMCGTLKVKTTPNRSIELKTSTYR